MTLIHLLQFMEVARRQNMTEAAENLHITQPALSKTIAKIEKDLGVKLFDRVGRRLILNEYGREVLFYTELINGCIQDMQSELEDIQGGGGGKVLVCSSLPIRDKGLLNDCISEYSKEYPDVQLFIYHKNHQQLCSDLESRKVDVVISSEPIRLNGIRWINLYQEKMGIIVSVKDPLAIQSSVSISDLKNRRLYCYDDNSDVMSLIRHFCFLAGFIPSVHFSGALKDVIGKAISKGLGISIISESGYHPKQLTGEDKDWEKLIVYRPLREEFCSRTVGIAYSVHRHIPKAARIFSEYIIDNCHKRWKGALVL